VKGETFRLTAAWAGLACETFYLMWADLLSLGEGDLLSLICFLPIEQAEPGTIIPGIGGFDGVLPTKKLKTDCSYLTGALDRSFYPCRKLL
jgi:hypothetical protein